MAAIILPQSIENAVAELQVSVLKLQNARPQVPATPAAPPAFALLASTTGAGPAAFPAVLGGIGVTNTAFTLAADGNVMVIGTGSVGNPLQPNMGGNCSVGVISHGFAPLAEASFSTSAVGNFTVYLPVTSIYVVSLAAGAYFAQWQAIITGVSASLNNWSVFVFQLGGGSAGSPGFG